MKEMDYKKYQDKIYGCYLGVSIGGLIGAPYEGAKEIIDVPIDLSVAENMLFNDDLDLQVLFFEAAEKYGMRFNANQLAKLFFTRCPYAPGEYAFFKKNYERGILPPYSGTFNNDFYSEGMGCCIRGELWGCLFPGSPESAKRYAYFDGCLDHGNESIYSEYFVASMISLCFVHSDINTVLKLAAEQIPEKSKFRGMLDNVLSWCDEIRDIDVLRQKILWEYGHPDCTNVYQNLAFTVAGLKLYFDDFELLISKTLRCGFDTDCTCGIAAAVWGAVHGGEALRKKYGFKNVKLVLGVDCNDYGGTVYSFAEAVAKRGAKFSAQSAKGVKIVNAPEVAERYETPVLYELGDYDPVLEFDKEKTVTLRAYIPEGKKGKFTYVNDCLRVLSFTEENRGDYVLLTLKVVLNRAEQVPANLCGKIVFTASGGIEEESCIPLGFAPPVILEVFEPRFDTCEHVRFEGGKNYYGHFESEKDDRKRFDKIRDYHLNYTVPDINDDELLKRLSQGENLACKKTAVYADKFDTGCLTGYRGPCVLYLRRTIFVERERSCMLWCGCEGKASIWLNGEKLTENSRNTFFTYENLHVNRVNMRSGINYLVFRIVRETGREYFSCNILEDGNIMDFPNHFLDYRQCN